VSEKPFVSFLFAFMASAIPVFGAAILLSLTVAGRPVELPKDVAQSSSHAKPAGQPRIDPDRALLATLFESTDPDPVASVPDQPETVTEPDAGDDSSSPTDEMNVALTSAPAAMSPLSEGNAPEETETIHPADPIGGRPEGQAMPRGSSGPPETEGRLLGTAQEPASHPSKKPNGSAYGARVYAALANHKPTAVERGSTTVTFEIGGGGVLGDVRVGQSSGNARLDQTALQMVRDAAPFPPPPSGASFYTIQIDFQ
jgi:protein TonB